MTQLMSPTRESDIADAVADAQRGGERLMITGGGTKSGVGRAVEARALSLSGLAGIVDYDPPELVLTVLPGTPLAEIEALVAAERQMLAFEPFDHAAMLRGNGAATIGGVVAAGAAGSRRVSAGAARDHMLGFRAVNGRGEAFVAGAKVVKNVTGYDLPKLAAGSWGRLFALTELTLKVMPRPETSGTWFLAGLDPADAVAAMAAAMGSQSDVACAAHRPASAGTPALTAIRLEGFEPSVNARGAMLESLLARFGAAHRAPEAEAATYWADLRTLAPLGQTRDLWRINVAPSRGPAVVAALSDCGADWLMDWAGGLIWAAVTGRSAEVRAAAAAAEGHASLLRADAAIRAEISAFHPPAPGFARLEERVRRAFDPAGVFETGRF